ncbi:MAG TPA: xanthine dehydrogenase accessory protein XdhC [Burkholderiaceae bacterium]|nr:xanthine dehydrogenase accessory protein XdhC [Burkholderiaceae bacterium]
MRLQDTARLWAAGGRPAVVVEVVDTQGSAPREAGARMLVAADEVAGTIGGGHLELQAIELARARLAAGHRQVFDQRYPLGPALGQCCGGVVTLRFASLDERDVTTWPEEPVLFTLQLYGAGHVGRAIARLLATLPCRVQWIDERAGEFPDGLAEGRPEARTLWPAHIEPVCVDTVEAEVDEAPPGAYYLVLTHRHDLDLRICEAILRRRDFAYLGLIGSKTKRARFEHQLLGRGIAPEALARMTCPIGVPGIEGKAPEVIAVAVAAQLLQHANAARRQP